MNELDTPPTNDSPETPARSSLMSRMLNVIAAPSEVFDEIRSAPHRTVNWLVPAMLLTWAGCVGLLLCFSQPAIQQQMDDIIAKAMDKQAAQVPMNDQARQLGEKIGKLSMKISMLAEPVVTGFAMPFWWGLVLWVVGSKVYKGGFSYMKAVEVAGLTNVVCLLEFMVRTLLAIALGSLFAGLHLGMVVQDFDAANPAHMSLAAANLFSFWALAVRALGLAKLGGISFGKALATLFVLWVVFMAAMTGCSLALQRLGGP